MAYTIQDSSGFLKVGCRDPLATNYDVSATQSCDGCCEYGGVTGCMDTYASNYDPKATIKCTNCCTYQATSKLLSSEKTTYEAMGALSPTFGDTHNSVKACKVSFIDYNGRVGGVDSFECCNETVIGKPAPGYEYYWDSTEGICYYRQSKCSDDVLCVDCNTFDWWNDTYIVNHNYQSLQRSSPIIWQTLLTAITNNGISFYAQKSTGDLIDKDCCKRIGGYFYNNVCFCELLESIQENYETKCISTKDSFSSLGQAFISNYKSSIGSALELTNSQMDEIIEALYGGVGDPSNALILLSNALYITGGFNISFGEISNTPIMVTKDICDTKKTVLIKDVATLTNTGYWDVSNNMCMCKPVNDQCEIKLEQVTTNEERDIYSNVLQVATYLDTGNPLSEACCNKIINDYDKDWVWLDGKCYVTPPKKCVPVTFTMGEKSTVTPECQDGLKLSMWVYFGKPANPCQEIVTPSDIDVVVINGESCNLKYTPNTYELIGSVPNDYLARAANRLTTTETTTPRESFGTFDQVGNVNSPNTITSTCCYNQENPILARIITTDTNLNQTLIQVKTYNSTVDYFDRWILLEAKLPQNLNQLNFNLKLEIFQGLNCCCEYDIFVDDIKIVCSKEEPSDIVNDLKCPGFNLTKVIDNKKSWVYNPGLPYEDDTEYDINERNDGSYGTLNGEGVINRNFAPSLDANVPWRYTDYFKQSSVYERHSNLVLNSKELWLTYDMCAKCPISGTTTTCPEGFSLSANTNICYKIE